MFNNLWEILDFLKIIKYYIILWVYNKMEDSYNIYIAINLIVEN